MAKEERSGGRAGPRAHVVVIPFPARGHVNPMLQMAVRLAAEDGISVTFVNSEADARLMKKKKKEKKKEKEIGAGAGSIRFVEIPDGMPPDVDRSTYILDLCKSTMANMGPHFHSLIGQLMTEEEEEEEEEDGPPTCIVADMRLASFSVATALHFGLSHGSFWTQSAASFSSLHAIHANGDRPPPEDFSVPGATFLKPTDFHSFIKCYDPSDIMFRFVTSGFDILDQSRWIIINTIQELEQETLDDLVNEKQLHTILPIGPLLPLPFINEMKRNKDKDATNHDAIILRDEHEGCISWLNQFKPNSVLYVSFGSLASVSGQQIEEIALGLEDSGYPFLWVTRPNMMYGQSPNFSIDFLERVKDRACFVDWAPQLDVLSHTSVGGFFTHCGWNSTLEAITAGTPILGWPFFADQPMNCKCVEQGWKVGLSLHDDDNAPLNTLVSRNVIKTKVEELMTTKKIQDKVNEWSLLSIKASIKDGSSSNNFLSLVESLKSHPL